MKAREIYKNKLLNSRENYLHFYSIRDTENTPSTAQLRDISRTMTRNVVRHLKQEIIQRLNRCQPLTFIHCCFFLPFIGCTMHMIIIYNCSAAPFEFRLTLNIRLQCYEADADADV